MWFLFGEVSSSSGALDGLRYFIVALPESPYNNFPVLKIKTKRNGHGKFPLFCDSFVLSCIFCKIPR